MNALSPALHVTLAWGLSVLAVTSACDSNTVDDAETAPPPPPSGLLADQRWKSGGLGTSTAALLGESATSINTGGGLLSVVAPATVGYPFDSNVLRLLYSGGWGHVIWDNLFPLPAAGQFWAFTFDTMNETGQTSTEQHPHTLWPIGAIEAVTLQYWTTGGGNGAWIPGVNYNFAGWAPFGLRPYRTLGNSSTQIVVPPGSFVRVSTIMAWDGPNTFRLFVKVDQVAADGTITPLITPNMWSSTENGQNTTGLVTWQNASPNNRARANDLNHIRTLAFGRAQSQVLSNRAYYIAGFRAGLVTSETDFIPGLTR